MYARSVDERYDNCKIIPPDNYSGNAFPDRSTSNFPNDTTCPPQPAEESRCEKNEFPPPTPPEKIDEDCKNCLKFADEKCPESRGEKKRDDCHHKEKGGLLGRLFGGGKGIGTEELVIIGLVIFLIFSKKDEENDDCDDEKDDNIDLIIILGLILLLS